ncbi:ATP-binding protein [Mycoplasma sp. Pen4]|uniref:DnaA ATPase domain-containing protein n=1 Tax=Mycoplasma sp. Pen4 TaxID=640330 RepID=UPI0016540FE2|nr:DnaA/Hda family protein [Mycoplasma sp. Pen4]QNM93650.1 ATP-binding protein [Mycoplasma sp. Pen4]
MNKIEQSNITDSSVVDLKVYSDLLREYIKNEIADNMLFRVLFKDLSILSIENNEVVIFFPKVYPDLYNFKNYHQNMFRKAVDEVFGTKYGFKIIDQEYVESQKVAAQEIKKVETVAKKSNNSAQNNVGEYTFVNYVESKFNREALSICRSVASGHYDFNVLFISGASGLGKTHLLKAIEYEFKKQNKKSFIVNPNTFSQYLANLLKENDQTKLMTMQRNLVDVFDIVLFDDFQFFGEGNKKSTKDFIFQILDLRMQKNKITIFCSDKDINEISPMFDNRLITRFQSGFITKIKRPDHDDLSKILDFLLDVNDIDTSKLSHEAKDFIIRNHTNSIRTLLGAVKRVSHYKKEISETPQEYILNTIKSIFENVIQQKENITPEVIIKAVSKYYKVPTKDILSSSRKSEIVIARHIAIYMISIHLNYSSTEIGKVFKKDHTTILNALKKLKATKDESLKRTVQELQNQIYKIN